MKGLLNPGLKLAIPSDENPPSKFLTRSGTFKEGGLLVNSDGIRVLVDGELVRESLIKPSDNQLSLAELEVLETIGKGNDGYVQLVQHKWTGQFFALKVIQMNADESTRKSIAQELKINQSSDCPYIAKCYQAFYNNGTVSIVLEYMDGGSLFDFLKKVKIIPEPYLAAICKQVLLGLIYLHHKKHIIHRDLKPSNLLINHRGEVKITDFGVSTVLASTSGLANSFIGTYNYMSPERISGGWYDHKSDIWSLGVILLECASGQFPYNPLEKNGGWSSVYELMEAIVDQPPPCASSDKFSPRFCSFISACLQKNPKCRVSAIELLKHEFLDACDGTYLSSYFIDSGSSLKSF